MTELCDLVSIYFFVFKQKTAYEMRISDWSSDVCSSDLIEQAGVASIARHAVALEVGDMPGERRRAKLRALMPDHTGLDDDAPGIGRSAGAQPRNAASTMEIGRAHV